MATDEALKKTETAASGKLAVVARAVTRPGGLSIDWSKVRAGSAAIAGLALLHGLKRQRWRYIHTIAVVVGVAAAAATVLQNKETHAPRLSADR